MREVRGLETGMDVRLLVSEAPTAEVRAAILAPLIQYNESKVDTHEFQARPFYERLGYTCFGELNDYPKGFRRFFMWKRLVAAGAGISHGRENGV